MVAKAARALIHYHSWSVLILFILSRRDGGEDTLDDDLLSNLFRHLVVRRRRGDDGFCEALFNISMAPFIDESTLYGYTRGTSIESSDNTAHLFVQVQFVRSYGGRAVDNDKDRSDAVVELGSTSVGKLRLPSANISQRESSLCGLVLLSSHSSLLAEK